MFTVVLIVCLSFLLLVITVSVLKKKYEVGLSPLPATFEHITIPEIKYSFKNLINIKAA